MEIKSKKIKGVEYSFVNEYWETSYAWGHKTTLLKNGYEIATAKVRYYNRTWENYRYQSCMYQALGNYKDNQLKRFLDDYLYTNGKSRFGKGEKAKAIQDFEKSEDYKTIKKLYDAIKFDKFSK